MVIPVLAVIAVCIRLDSDGPALFRQQRVREGGRRFTMLKFRTMSVDAEQAKAALTALNDHGNGILFKMRNDPRVTRVGRVLRATSLDELPQLVNVLRGEMSLVGPRPALPSEVALYDETAERRLAVKPGLTGLWQVSGRSNLSWDESLRLDLHYVDNWRHRIDLGILVRTIKTVVRRDGAC
jgi:lipopolysaccharide/colanic/teichoic acid biosynthesis glycosyltransferase